MICSCVNLDCFIIRLLLTDSTSKRGHSRRQGHRYNTIIGQILKVRTLANEQAEAKIGCNLLKQMASRGMAISVRVTSPRPSRAESCTSLPHATTQIRGGSGYRLTQHHV
jgi:hypothetical protein